jgi:hypothetical protein
MKKYEFIKNGTDDYTLKYKDKEINFNSNVSIVNRLQNTIVEARKKMMIDLAKEGMTVKDLIIERKENGKTYYDNTNKDELEKAYIEDVQGKIFSEVIKELLGIDLAELYLEIGITTDEENEEFVEEFGNILVGQYNTP